MHGPFAQIDPPAEHREERAKSTGSGFRPGARRDRPRGIGIAPEFLPQVFDRFSQQDGEAATTRRLGGLGLGLAIVRHIVELHGGTVEAQSGGIQKGATFIVRLPIAPVRSSPTEATPVHSSLAPSAVPINCPTELEGLHVLVLDDEPDARDLLRTALEHCKAVVTTAASVPEALAIVRSPRKPDVIVSDIGMPDEDGYSFIRKVRALPRGNGGRIPPAALTAFARPEDRRRALIAGFQNHAAKPIEPQELLIVVANLAGRYTSS